MPKPQKGSFAYIAAKIRSEAKGTEFGLDFERLCKFFLENDPVYGDVRKVWLWYDWPDRWGVEKGCDIVVQTKQGEYWAVQAKDYSISRSVSKADIDSFLADSARKIFSHRILITSTTRISPNALELFHATGKRKQRIPLAYVDRSGLEASPIKWPTTIGRKPRQRKPKPLPKKPHQTKAVNAVVKGFKGNKRGRLIMACGSGKTNVALLITEKLQTKRVLVLVPSLGLVNQFISEWCRHKDIDFEYRLVCSDQTVNPKGLDPAIQRVADLGVPVTTKVKDIRRFLGGRARTKKVVVSTYHSVEQIANAQRSKKIPQFDIVICDEAHRTAAATESYYSLVLNEKKIRSRRRLFMTATPKYISGTIKKKAEEEGFDIVSMDDEEVYGPEFHRFSFSEAIRVGELGDYRLVVVGVTDNQVKSLIEKAKIVRAKGISKTDTYSLAKSLGLIKTINKYKLRKMITFHHTINKAKGFSSPDKDVSISTLNRALPKTSRIAQTLWTDHINGGMTAGARKTTLHRLEHFGNSTVGLVSNVACLGEGINVPDLDSIAFIDPKASEIGIIQAVGRAIRKPRASKKVSTIYVPIVIGEGDSEIEVFKTNEFKSVLKIIWALRSHDDDLGEILDKLRFNLKNDPKSRRIHLPKKLIFDLPKRIGIPQFQQKITTRIIVLSTHAWEANFSALLAYKSIYGHCNVPIDADAPFDLLGQWVHSQRSFYRRDLINRERIQRLEGIGFRWHTDDETLSIKQTRKMLTAGQIGQSMGYKGQERILALINNGEIEPDGYGYGREQHEYGPIQAFFNKNRISELKKHLGITLVNTKDLLNEHQIRKEYGISSITSIRERGGIKAKGRGVSDGGGAVGYLYTRESVEKLQKQLGKEINMSHKKKLLSFSSFAPYVGISTNRLAKCVKQGLIRPHATIYNPSLNRKTGYFHNNQKRPLLRALGVTLFNTENYFSEDEASKHTGLNIGHHRRQGHIKENGMGLSTNKQGHSSIVCYYTAARLEQHKKSRGITLDSVQGLLSLPEFLKKTGASETAVRRAVRTGVIQPAGKAMDKKGLALITYFDKRQFKKFKTNVKVQGPRKRGRITVVQIVDLMIDYYRKTEEWPICTDNEVPDHPADTWPSIDQALRKGYRGLRVTGSSIAKLRPQAIQKAKKEGLLS
jgi:superfamily II DNA or RNA helicase